MILSKICFSAITLCYRVVTVRFSERILRVSRLRHGSLFFGSIPNDLNGPGDRE
jgi:hypothetical protein